MSITAEQIKPTQKTVGLAEETLNYIKQYFPPGNYKYCKGNIEVAIYTFEEKLKVCPAELYNEKWELNEEPEYVENPTHTQIKEVIEYINTLLN